MSAGSNGCIAGSPKYAAARPPASPRCPATPASELNSVVISQALLLEPAKLERFCRLRIAALSAHQRIRRAPSADHAPAWLPADTSTHIHTATPRPASFF